MSPAPYDVAVIGGGILGLATALDLCTRYAGLRLIVLEKEHTIAAHQTGHNSGIIHSGLYYRPGASKARMAVQGADRLVEFCRTHDIPHERCGKIVVATTKAQLPALEDLERRGRANGVPGIETVGPQGLRELEPHARGLRALHVPSTGIVDFVAVAHKYCELMQARGGELRLGMRVDDIRTAADTVRLQTTVHGPIEARYVINCAGLFADRISARAGTPPPVTIIPFRGEYYELIPTRRHLVRNLIYPVSNPAFPFLGVHFSRRIGGAVEAGPNAVLALCREGYRWRDFSARDTLETLRAPGFLRLARRYWRTGASEIYRSASKRAFVRALQTLVPEVRASDLQRSGAGVRAQAMEPDGALVDDFRIERTERMIHVLNAPSPAATASLAIGAAIADLTADWFGAVRPPS